MLFRASIVAALLFAFASTAHAQEAIVYVGKLPLNLRTGPGAAFPSLAELQPGEALRVIGQSGLWLNVTRVATGETGWVNRNFVTGSASAAPPAVPVAPNQVTVGKLPVNLRSGPGLTHPKLAELQPGEILAVIGQAGKWLSVTRVVTGQTGWVNGDYVVASALPVAVPPSAAPPAPATPTLPPDAPPAPESSFPLNAVVADGPLNFRDGPGKNYRALFRLPTGQYLTILSDDGVWASVRLPSGMEGWVMIQYLARLDAPPTSGTCRSGDVLKNVHEPERLTVFDRCVTATGTVTEITRNPDGDLTFRLALDPADVYLLNDGNRNLLRGYLQIEIIPADQPLVAEPVPGAHVTVTGAYVLDTEYGWMEIHPVWFVGP